MTTANQSEIRRAYLVSVGQYFGGIFKIMLEYKVDTRYTGNSYCSKADSGIKSGASARTSSYNMHMKRGNYMKKRIAVALTTLCITLLTGCGMSAKMEINPDLSGTVSMEVDTTSEEEKQIEQYMNSQQGSTSTTYADMMKEMEFTANGTKVLNGKEHNSYLLSQQATAEDMKSSFLELTHEKAVLNIAQESQTTGDVNANVNTNLSGLDAYDIRVKFPFVVAKTNGTLQADGQTVVFDILKLYQSGTERIYAMSQSAVEKEGKIEISGVKDKKAYKKNVKLTVSTGGVITSFKVNGKAQTEDSYTTTKDGAYKAEIETAAGTKQTVIFCVDRKKPTTNVKNNKVYKKNLKITFQDKVSGIKKATLNGKKIKSGKTIKKNGTYTLKIVDKAGNVKKVKFKIQK